MAAIFGLFASERATARPAYSLPKLQALHERRHRHVPRAAARARAPSHETVHTGEDERCHCRPREGVLIRELSYSTAYSYASRKEKSESPWNGPVDVSMTYKSSLQVQSVFDLPTKGLKLCLGRQSFWGKPISSPGPGEDVANPEVGVNTNWARQMQAKLGLGGDRVRDLDLGPNFDEV